MDIEAMKARVFAEKPTFGRVITEWGDRTWEDYYTHPFENLRLPSEDILAAIREETALIFNDTEKGVRAGKALENKKWVSTADHHGLLSHPYFYSSNLAQSGKKVQQEGDALVTLSFGNISLGNDSFPRGFFFHDALFRKERFLFKSLQDRSLPVTVLLPVAQETFQREMKRMSSVPLSKEARGRFEAFLSALLNTEEIWSAPSYSTQLSRMNTVLWSSLFGEERGELIYVEIDRVVERLLRTKHLVGDTLISQILFTPRVRERYLALFEGIPGAHSHSGGTELFWYIDYKERKRKRLIVTHDALVTEDGVHIPLTQSHIADALLRKEIIPSSALLLMVVHGEEGLACAGGVSQLDYLSSMTKAWNTLRSEVGMSPLPELNTSIVGGEHILFEIAHASEERSLPSLIDLLLYADSPQEFVEDALAHTSIRDTIEAMIPSLYRLITRESIQLRSPHTLSTLQHSS
jgi:hypothetical protein